MSLPTKTKNSFEPLLQRMKEDFPDIGFKPDETFKWSSESRTVYYNSSFKYAAWSLLHELGHMLSNHAAYKSDSALVRMEVEAWDKALELANRYGCLIDEEHIQDCIDSYRNWQYMRSMCPRCAQTGLERSNGRYTCINCREAWNVTTNRLCRVYRKLSPRTA